MIRKETLKKAFREKQTVSNQDLLGNDFEPLPYYDISPVNRKLGTHNCFQQRKYRNRSKEMHIFNPHLIHEDGLNTDLSNYTSKVVRP